MLVFPFITVFASLLSLQVAIAGSKRFIVRVDDIQDFFDNTAQADILTFLMDNNIAVTAGIIGGYFTGTDPVIYNPILRCTQMDKNKCALFNHGVDAVYMFGNGGSVAEEQAILQTCDSKIRSIYPGYFTEVMVPNENSWNAYTLTAVDNLGYYVISASESSYSGMAWDLTKRPLQMPQQTSTANYDANNVWTATPISQTYADCVAADSRGEACVIMMHPMEFASGQYTIAMLQTLLVDTLIANGWTSVNFHTIAAEVLGLNAVSSAPTAAVTLSPTKAPTVAPTKVTSKPTVVGATSPPSFAPSIAATASPSPLLTFKPTTTASPTATGAPSFAVTIVPSAAPTYPPSAIPTIVRTATPTISPSQVVHHMTTFLILDNVTYHFDIARNTSQTIQNALQNIVSQPITVSLVKIADVLLKTDHHWTIAMELSLSLRSSQLSNRMKRMDSTDYFAQVKQTLNTAVQSHAIDTALRASAIPRNVTLFRTATVSSFEYGNFTSISSGGSSSSSSSSSSGLSTTNTIIVVVCVVGGSILIVAAVLVYWKFFMNRQENKDEIELLKAKRDSKEMDILSSESQDIAEMSQVQLDSHEMDEC